ncbi:MAG: HAD family hydrolase [Planctomycetota bacterium]|jgi:phosphoglycolate phosphatase
MRYPLAVFDFDGTIADTRRPITLSANRALEELGYERRADEDVQQLVGLPLAEVMRGLAGLEKGARGIEALCERYRAVFKEVAPLESPLFDGVRAALDALRAAGVQLAIATSRSRESLEMFLGQHELRGHFSFWAGGHCIERGKPHPEMLEYVLSGCGRHVGDALMIGDTTHDMEMGRAAGMDTCAVTYGMHDAQRLEAADPTYLVHAAHELPDVVLSLA